MIPKKTELLQVKIKFLKLGTGSKRKMSKHLKIQASTITRLLNGCTIKKEHYLRIQKTLDLWISQQTDKS